MFVGFKSKNHPQQVGKRGANPLVDDRALTKSDFDRLNKRFRFTIDVAASSENAKCERFYSIEDDGLNKSWAGESVYCNPPYSEIFPWIIKAWRERMAKRIVLLLPANRTEQIWWQRGIEIYRDRVGSVLKTEHMQGRWRFLKPGQSEIGPNERPPFGVVLCIWDWESSTAGEFEPSESDL